MKSWIFAFFVPFALAGCQDLTAPSVLVFDLQRAVENCDEAREVIEELARKRAEEQKVIDQRRKEMSEQQAALKKKAMQDLTEEDLKKIRELNERIGALTGQAEEFNVRIGLRLLSQSQGLWQDAQKFAKEIMKERGAEVVVLTRAGPLRIGNDEQLSQEYLLRRAVVADEKAQDITEEVIARMNADYKARKK
jgi:Skp family chaperone for outer membrane proteins